LNAAEAESTVVLCGASASKHEEVRGQDPFDARLLAADLRRDADIVIVQTDPGYEANPGHDGTGTVVAAVC
jgi:hypothetical protein